MIVNTVNIIKIYWRNIIIDYNNGRFAHLTYEKAEVIMDLLNDILVGDEYICKLFYKSSDNIVNIDENISLTEIANIMEDDNIVIIYVPE